MTLTEEMARSLQLPEAFVSGVARTASHRYKEFMIPKADRKSMRMIEQPSKELKLMQRWLVRRVLDRFPTHECAHAYVEGRSIATNAAAHRGSSYLSRLDLENFFPSLTSQDLRSFLTRPQVTAGQPYLSDADIGMICDLVCRFGRLTIGAPSSPTISNKLLYDLDVRLARTAEGRGARYTRYADDLYFSSSTPGVLYEVCEAAEGALADTPGPRLRINRKKTYHTSRKRRMAVTGLRLTPDRNLSVGRDLKRTIRAAAYRARRGGATDEELDWLRGMLAYVSSIEPDFVSRIRQRYGTP